MNLGRKGANKAQERAQTLAHGHPWGLGRSLTVILLSLLQPSCGLLSCLFLLTLYTAVMRIEILFPIGLWVFEPGWLLDHSQLW